MEHTNFHLQTRWFPFVQRIFSLFMTLFTISVLTFLLIKLAPGDPAANYLRVSHIPINEETLANARQFLGLDKPVFLQYTDWLFRVLRGDLGTSYLQKLPVRTILANAMIPTLQLGVLSFVLLLILSLTFGIFSALYHGKLVDYFVQGLSFVCVSIPTFWLGYLLIILFAVSLNWLPVSGRGGLQFFILPAVTMMKPLIGQTSLLIRKSILEQMNQPHVINALIRGVNRRYIILNHLLKNASIPIITVFSSNILYLITGSVLIEEIFAWPGIGKMFTAAVRGGDIPVIQGALLLFGIAAIVINALTQRIVHRLDPHLRIQQGGNRDEA